MPCLSPTHGADAIALESQGLMRQDKNVCAFSSRVTPCLSPTHEADAIARKEKSMPFGDHNGSLLRRQPGAGHDASFGTVSQACMTVMVVVACTMMRQLA